jgi:serine/threonine protein kinase
MSLYKIIDVIGSGGYGVVLAALDKIHKKRVALKIVFKKDSRGESLRREYELLKEM